MLLTGLSSWGHLKCSLIGLEGQEQSMTGAWQCEGSVRPQVTVIVDQ